MTLLLLPEECTSVEESVLTSALELPLTAADPAPEEEAESSPDVVTDSLSKCWVTSPLDQMFWLTDWSVMVSRSSTFEE